MKQSVVEKVLHTEAERKEMTCPIHGHFYRPQLGIYGLYLSCPSRIDRKRCKERPTKLAQAMIFKRLDELNRKEIV